MPIEKFDVRNRWTGAVQFTAEIECAPATAHCAKLGLAVRWAQKSRADLSGAVLRGADLRDADLSDAVLRGADLRDADLSDAVLRGADLRGADLRGAVLSGADLSYADLSDADLSDADLSDADLRPFKADLWMTLTENATEVPALVEALKAGRVDGSQYEGECACLVGTIAKAKSVHYENLHHNASDPAERWFAMIRKGDKPGDDSGGGYAAAIALAWIEEWQRCHALAAGADR